MKFHIVTIFPRIFDSYLGESLFKRAIQKKLISVKTHDLRAFTDDRHNKVDDRPYGGGAGMVMKVQPFYRAVASIKKTIDRSKKNKTRVILFSTRGKIFDAKEAQRLAKYDALIFLCGRYEGVDERVAQQIADEEISMGPYVLSGGELPAMTVIEAVSRFLPGFLGKNESLEEVKGSYPVYTRPEIFEIKEKKGTRMTMKKWKVPEELISGNHKEIEKWRTQGK